MAVTFDGNISTYTNAQWERINMVKYDASAGTYTAITNNPSAFDYFTNDATVDDWIAFTWTRGVWHDLTVNVGTAMAGSGHTIVWEYSGYTSAGALQWNALTCTDNTTGFTVTGSNSITFSVPDDWGNYNARYYFSATLTGGYVYGPWIRARLSAVTYSTGAVVFTGTGLNDATSGGTYSGSANTAVYEVEIDATGTPDTFKWKKDGGAYTTGVAITGAAQTLSDAITITFAATTGHTLGDKWVITVTSITEGGANATSTLEAKDHAIKVTGTETPASIYAADVAGGWSMVTKLGDMQYLCEANLRIGDSSTAGTFVIATDGTTSECSNFQLGRMSRTNTGTSYFYKKRSLIAPHATGELRIGYKDGSSNMYYCSTFFYCPFGGFDPYLQWYCKLKMYSSLIKWMGTVGYENAYFGGQTTAGDIDIQGCVIAPEAGTLFVNSIPTGTSPFYNNVYVGGSTSYLYSFDADFTINNMTFNRGYGVLIGINGSVSNVNFGSAKLFVIGNSGYTGDAINCTFSGASYDAQVNVSINSTNTANVKYDLELNVYDSGGTALSSVNCRIKDSQGNIIHNGAYSAAVRLTVYKEYGSAVAVTKTTYDPFEIWVWKTGYEMYYEKLSINNNNRKRYITLLQSPTLGRAGMGSNQR